MSAKCQKRILVSATFGKNSRSHMRNPEFVFADRAAENFIARIARNVPEWRQTAFFDPAARTKIIAPAFNRKIRKPLRSKARRIVFRLYLRYLLLSLGKAALDMRQALFSNALLFPAPPACGACALGFELLPSRPLSLRPLSARR